MRPLKFPPMKNYYINMSHEAACRKTRPVIIGPTISIMHKSCPVRWPVKTGGVKTSQVETTLKPVRQPIIAFLTFELTFCVDLIVISVITYFSLLQISLVSHNLRNVSNHITLYAMDSVNEDIDF